MSRTALASSVFRFAPSISPQCQTHYAIKVSSCTRLQAELERKRLAVEVYAQQISAEYTIAEARADGSVCLNALAT